MFFFQWKQPGPTTVPDDCIHIDLYTYKHKRKNLIRLRRGLKNLSAHFFAFQQVRSHYPYFIDEEIGPQKD